MFHVVIPVGNRICGFELEGHYGGYIRSGLNMVNGVNGREVPGAVAGVQVKDAGFHDLDVTVRLEGANATITSTLDNHPLYEWAGPITALTQQKKWATTEPGKLGFGTQLDAWVVTKVKIKRLQPSVSDTTLEGN